MCAMLFTVTPISTWNQLKTSHLEAKQRSGVPVMPSMAFSGSYLPLLSQKNFAETCHKSLLGMPSVPGSVMEFISHKLLVNRRTKRDKFVIAPKKQKVSGAKVFLFFYFFHDGQLINRS